MKTSTSSYIEIDISMVHPMHPPETWHRVKQYVLQINHEIQQDHRCSHRTPSGQRDIVHQSPATLCSEQGQGRCRGRKHDSHQTRIEHSSGKVVRPAEKL